MLVMDNVTVICCRARQAIVFLSNLSIVLDVPGSWRTLHLGKAFLGGLVRLNQATLTPHMIVSFLSDSSFCSFISHSPFFILQFYVLHCNGFKTRFSYLDSSLDTRQIWNWKAAPSPHDVEAARGQAHESRLNSISEVASPSLNASFLGSGSLRNHLGSSFGSRSSSLMGGRSSHHSKAGACHVMTVDPDLPRWQTRALERPK